MEQIDLQPFHWEYRDVDGHVQILCWALTEGKDCKEESEAHLVRIENFRTSFWIELPRFVNGRVLKWDESMAGHYYNYISDCMKKKRCSPIGYTFDHRMDIYNYQTRTKPYLLMIFPTTKAMQETEKFLSKKREFYIGKNRIGWIEAKVWEADIPTIRKMLTFKDCKFSGWLRFKGYHPKARGTLYDSDDGGKGVDIEYDKMGRAIYRERDEEQFEQISKLPLGHEWIVDWSDIEMTPATEPISKSITYPKVLAYDIEVYSDNVRKFPDMLTREHCVFMISCVFQRAGKPETRRYHALVCGDVNEIPVERWTTLKGAVVEKYTDELDLISGMARLVNEYDVDVLTGYNVYDFDNPYMDARLKLSLRKEWPHMGRLLDDKTEMFSSTWESGGYGFNSINDLKISGRITIDMLPVVRRGLQKLLKYNLETVAKHFLDRGKHDVTPAEMFLSFERNREAIQAWNDMLEKANPTSFSMEDLDTRIANNASPEDDNEEEVAQDYEGEEDYERDEDREDYDYDQDEDTDDQKQSQADSAAMTEYKRICNEIMSAVNEELLEAEKILTSEDAGKKWLQERDVKNEEIRKAIYANSFRENEAKMQDRKKAWRAEFEEKYTKEELMDIRAKYSQAEVKAELVMHDNLNDPARSPMYTREGKLNWCSIETWDYFVALGKDCVRARGLKPPEGADVDVLVTFSAAKYLMTRILVYCLFDSDLCIELFEKLTVWIGLIQMSSVVGVTPLDLFTRGQQIRCLSQLYDRGSKMGYILNKRPSPDIYFNGGFVFNVVPGIYDGVMVEDFASLYPSIMIAYNICYSTLLLKKDFGTLPEDDVFTITVPRPDAVAEDGAEYDLTQEHDMDEEKSDEEIAEDEEESVAKDRKNQIMASLADVVSDKQNFYFQFVKPSVKEGILPGILRTLIAERKAVREEQKQYDKGTLMWKILEEKQLAIKVSSNSMFGFLGAGKMGKRSLIEGAMSITAMGRKLITHVNKKVEEEYGCKMVYGDSVTADTPILCRLNDEIFYRTIDDLPSNEEWKEERGKERRLPQPGLEVWSDKGFTPIKEIIRHKTTKRIYRISTPAGSVKVTKDHSLLRPNGVKVSPRDITIGSDLLIADLPPSSCKINERNNWYSYGKLTYEEGKVRTKTNLPPYVWKLGKGAAYDFYKGYVGFIDKYHSDDTSELLRSEIFALKWLSGIRIESDTWNHRVTLIEDLGRLDDLGRFEDKYVYDLETENHHFSAGVGTIVVHNTDSSMFSKPGIPANEFNSYGKFLEKEISKDFLDPLRLEFEKAMKMIALARKKYAGYVYKDDGTYVIDKDTGLPFLYLRGNVLARRDNAKWLRIVFEKLIRMALDEVPVEEMLLYLIDVVDKFMTDPIDHNALVTVRSVSAHYKNQTYFMKLFADRLAREGMPIRPGERIGYLVVKGRNDTENRYIGNRMVLPEMYLASRHEKNPYEIDRLYYLEKQFMNSIDQVIHAGFGKRMGGLMKIQYRKKGCRKYHGLDTPVQLMVKLYQNGVPIDKLRESILAVYNNDKRGPVLSTDYELNRYEYPKVAPLTLKTSKTAAPTSVVSVKEALQKARQNKLAEKKAVTSKSPPIKSSKGVNMADQFC